ncbi:MAG: TRAP transporter permease, partial [Pseudomonadota bacterium]|nr:TRAP transporter permease [Pseudomonadota bacterium]
MQAPPHPAIRGLVALLASLALLLAMDTLRLFGNQQWLQSLIGIETQYFYALLGLLAPWAFITYPTKPWIDWPLVAMSLVILGGFFVTAEQALD